MPRSRIQQERRRSPAFTVIALTFLAIGAWIGNDVLIEYESKGPSKSKGTRVDGSLMNGKRLPTTGPNFETYSRLLTTIGRTCVHEKVRAAVVQSYQLVYDSDPSLQFVYGETGWCWGGKFWPHRTHQNGLSVDFMVPVRQHGGIATLPTTIIDGWGYRDEFDASGRLGEFEIDFDAMALHLRAVEEAANRNGLEIDKVIFDPELQKLLKASKHGKKLSKKLEFNTDPAWIRHDEHYHVDFRLRAGTQAESVGFDNSGAPGLDGDPAPRQDWDSL